MPPYALPYDHRHLSHWFRRIICEFRILVNSPTCSDIYIGWRLPGVGLGRHLIMPKPWLESFFLVDMHQAHGRSGASPCPRRRLSGERRGLIWRRGAGDGRGLPGGRPGSLHTLASVAAWRQPSGSMVFESGDGDILWRAGSPLNRPGISADTPECTIGRRRKLEYSLTG